METFTELLSRSLLIIFALIGIGIANFYKGKTLSYFFNWNLFGKRTNAISLSLIIIIAVLFLKALSVLPVLLTVSYAVVFLLQPFLEEILFRGMIFGFLLKLFQKEILKKKRAMLIIFALVTQAVIFSALHFNSNILPMSLRFLAGILFSILFIHSKKNILLPTAAHLFYNYIIYLLGMFGFNF